MGLFSDLKKFGLGKYESAEVYEEKEADTKQDAKKEAAPIKEEDLLFDKHYTCPVCGTDFTSRTMKIGKVKPTGKDTDLRPVYGEIDPIKYDAITCEKCGYSALTRFFGKLSDRQIKDVKEGISSSFSGIDNKLVKYSFDDAILRYKLAVVTSMVKNAKNSEKAYTCFKLAWVLRAKRSMLPEGSPHAKELYDDEMECLKNAYEGFVNAMQNEQFPIAGMDENTLRYILADLARKLKKYEESARMIASVITARGVNSRIKDEALKLKDMIKEEMKAEAEAKAAQG